MKIEIVYIKYLTLYLLFGIEIEYSKLLYFNKITELYNFDIDLYLVSLSFKQYLFTI